MAGRPFSLVRRGLRLGQLQRGESARAHPLAFNTAKSNHSFSTATQTQDRELDQNGGGSGQTDTGKNNSTGSGSGATPTLAMDEYSSNQSAAAPARKTAMLMHGILGNKRNWRTCHMSSVTCHVCLGPSLSIRCAFSRPTNTNTNTHLLLPLGLPLPQVPPASCWQRHTMTYAY